MAADSKTSEYGCRRTVLRSWKELAILSTRCSLSACPCLVWLTQLQLQAFSWLGKAQKIETTFTKHAVRKSVTQVQVLTEDVATGRVVEVSGQYVLTL